LISPLSSSSSSVTEEDLYLRAEAAAAQAVLASPIGSSSSGGSSNTSSPSSSPSSSSSSPSSWLPYGGIPSLEVPLLGNDIVELLVFETEALAALAATASSSSSDKSLSSSSSSSPSSSSTLSSTSSSSSSAAAAAPPPTPPLATGGSAGGAAYQPAMLQKILAVSETIHIYKKNIHTQFVKIYLKPFFCLVVFVRALRKHVKCLPLTVFLVRALFLTSFIFEPLLRLHAGASNAHHGATVRAPAELRQRSVAARESRVQSLSHAPRRQASPHGMRGTCARAFSILICSPCFYLIIDRQRCVYAHVCVCQLKKERAMKKVAFLRHCLDGKYKTFLPACLFSYPFLSRGLSFFCFSFARLQLETGHVWMRMKKEAAFMRKRREGSR
jgi:hypothetical protein